MSSSSCWRLSKADRAATTAPRWRARSISHCKSANNQPGRTSRKRWQLDNMFEAHLTGRQSRVDWCLIAALFGLMIVGVAFIYSAKPPLETTAWYNHYYVRQIIWYAIGIAGAIAVCVLDYHSLARWSIVAY